MIQRFDEIINHLARMRKLNQFLKLCSILIASDETAADIYVVSVRGVGGCNIHRRP